MNDTVNNDLPGAKRKLPVGRIVAFSIVVGLAIGGILIYNNFNRLLSEALMRSFNSNIASDVYELQFEKLRVNIFEQSITVVNVVLRPRDKPLQDYPYINSSFRLKTAKISLEDVQIMDLLRSSDLKLGSISITKPEIQVLFSSANPIFLPFRDSTAVKNTEGSPKKKAIDGYALRRFALTDASFRVTNAAKQRAFEVLGFSLALNNLFISQQPGRDMFSLKAVDLSIVSFGGHLQKGAIKHIGFKDFKIGIDSLRLTKTIDTVTFAFDDFRTGLNALDIQTADSLFHFTMGSFSSSHKDKSIKLENLSFSPNISDAAMQSRFKYQHTQVSGSVGSINILQVNFDSLIHHRSLFIDEIVVDNPEVAIFKDNTKPVDLNRFPTYFGQQIGALTLPLRVRQVTVTRVNLVNVERKRDSSYAKVAIRRGTVSVKNITSLSKGTPLTLNAEAYIENKVHFNLRLDFSYQKPQFNLAGKLEKFNLPDLNPVLLAYTPAKINAGIADEISFSGTVNWTGSSGTMKFLYHDLEVDLDLQKKAKWKSSVLAFAANTIVNASNPGSADLPPRIVQLQAKRDMNKGFVNIIIKSILNGVKETMIMSKENRKAYQAAKKKSKQGKKSP